MNSTLTTYEDQTPRLRLIATLDNHGRISLLDVLHDARTSNLPRDPKKLYVELYTKHRAKLTKLRKKGVIKQEAWDLLFPKNQQTDSTKFDLTLCKLMIGNCTKLPAPRNGWKNLDVNDQSVAAFVVRIIELRNKIFHSPETALTETQFNNYWNELEINLRGIGYAKSITYLKSLPLEALGEDLIKAYHQLISEIFKCTIEQAREIAKSNDQQIKRNIQSNDQMKKQVLGMDNFITL